MKITVINNDNPIIKIISTKTPVIKIYTTGVQGIPGPAGPSGSTVIRETTESLTITDETNLVCKGTTELLIQLKDATLDDTAIVEILNMGIENVTARAFTGQLIFYRGQTDSEFTIPPGAVFSFVPKGSTQYVS